MLQDIRQNAQGTVAKIIVGLIVIAFSLFGIESILLGSGGSGVAEVNGEDITPQELQQAVNSQKRRLISMMGENVDPAMLDDQRLTGQAMDFLVQRKLQIQSAQSMDLVVSDGQAGTIIAAMEQFQVDGAFVPEVYRSVLSTAGYTPASFKKGLQEDMLLNQSRSGLAGSEFATPAELALSAQVVAEQRDLRYLTIPLDRFLAQEEVTDEDVADYYEQNSSDFLTEEAVELDYIELKLEDFRKPVEETAIAEAYELEIQDAQYKSEHRVSHILLEQGTDESAEAYGQRLNEVSKRLAEGGDFAELAREFSDDIGSAAAGGDLGFTSGDAFPQEMESAIAELELSTVSQPVKTEAGIHLIMVTERRDGEAPSLEEMHGQLEERIAMEEARVELLRTVESLKDLAFNAETLADPATELSLEVQQSEKLTRAQAEGLFANPTLRSAAFSEDVLVAGHNSDVLELSGGNFVVLRVGQHHQARVRPVAEVRGQIVVQIGEQRSREAVNVEADRAVAALRGGETLEAYALAQGYEWQVELGADRRNLNVPREVLQRVFTLPVPDEGSSIVDSVASIAGDARVFELVRVTVGELQALSESEREQLKQQVGGEYGQLVDNELQIGLRDSADINIL